MSKPYRMAPRPCGARHAGRAGLMGPGRHPGALFLAAVLGLAGSLSLAAATRATAGTTSADWNPSALATKVTELTISNGLRFLVLERHGTPVFSFTTLVNAGSVDENAGETGLAHMFEHMAFKGTRDIGTKDYGKEKSALEKVDELFMQLYAEREKGAKADTLRLKKLHDDIDAAQKQADTFVATNEFGQIVEREGGVGLNAQTASDATYYFYSLPSNKLELWAYLESDRFSNPVFREFYKERDVVEEERNMRVDSQPFGQFVEELLGVAYRAHAYKNLGLGHRSDLDALRLSSAKAFFDRYYTPQNVTVALVGDVYPEEVRKLAEKYFAKIPRRPDPPPVHTVEPPQRGQRRFVLHGDTQPIFGVAFHRPAVTDADDAALDVMARILGEGRTSRLYKRLVKQDKSALFAGAFNGFPGNKYPSLLVVFSIPNSGHGPEEMEKVTREEIEHLKTNLVSQEELDRVKTETRADFIRGLDSNSDLSRQLAEYEVLFGSWKQLFQTVARINAVTREQVQEAARKYLTEENSTVGSMVTKNDQNTAEK